MIRSVASVTALLSITQGLAAAVPTYSTFVLYARTNFGSNPGGVFNVPGSWFFSGEDIKVNDGAVTVNGAKVVKADVIASNGVIHVIDTVLMPPAK